MAAGRLKATLKNATLRLSRIMPSSVSVAPGIDLFHRRETAPLPDRARGRGTQIGDKRLGGGRSARRDDGDRVDDFRVGILRKYVHDPHLGLGACVGDVDNPKARLATR